MDWEVKKTKKPSKNKIKKSIIILNQKTIGKRKPIFSVSMRAA